VQTYFGRDYVVTRQTGADAAGFKVSMQEEEGNDFHAAENIGWLAIEAGSGAWSGMAYEVGSLTRAVNGVPSAGAFATDFSGAPNLLASLSTYLGRDQVSPRTVSIDANGFTAIAQEDTSFDAETNHGRESLDWLAIEGEGLLYAGSDVKVIPSFGGGEVIAEAGWISVNHTGATVSLAHAFANPVVIATVTSMHGAQEVIARISDVTADSFFVQLQEPDYLDGFHAWENVSFLVVEAGNWTLADGSVLRAGTTQMADLAANGFVPIAFDAAFSADPSVLAQVQTKNDAAFVKARIDARGPDGFGLALEEEQAATDGVHGSETVGWIALERGSGIWAGEMDAFVFEAGSTAAGGPGFAATSFDAEFAATPVLLGAIASYADADPAQLRANGLSAFGVSFKVEEDRGADWENAHGTEAIDWIAIGADGLLTGNALV
jgi:hypothetical protein